MKVANAEMQKNRQLFFSLPSACLLQDTLANATRAIVKSLRHQQKALMKVDSQAELQSGSSSSAFFYLCFFVLANTSMLIAILGGAGVAYLRFQEQNRKKHFL